MTVEVVSVRGQDELVESITVEQRFKRHWFTVQGQRHADTDLALYGLIEERLGPLLGESGIEERHKWFQETDYYGNGIRHLEFKPDVFQPEHIWLLHPLLKGRHRWFGILCWATTGPWKKTEGALALGRRVYATTDLASRVKVAQPGAGADRARSG
jgi:hypothetical protein